MAEILNFLAFWKKKKKNELNASMFVWSFVYQGADFKKQPSTKQESHQEYYSFLVNQFYLDQYEAFLLVQIKLFNKKRIIFFMKFMFRCLIIIKSPPWNLAVLYVVHKLNLTLSTFQVCKSKSRNNALQNKLNSKESYFE